MMKEVECTEEGEETDKVESQLEKCYDRNHLTKQLNLRKVCRHVPVIE